MSGKRRLAICAIVTTLVACKSESPGHKVTEVIVEIDAAPSLQAQAATLNVTVEGGDGIDRLSSRVTRLDETLKPFKLPKRVAIIPRDGDQDRAFVLTATLFDEDDSFLAQARLVSGFVADEVRYARLVVEGDACLEVRCDESSTCSNGACISAQIDVDELTSDSSRPTRVGFTDTDAELPGSDGGEAEGGMDAGPETDGGIDAMGGQDDAGQDGAADECAGGALSACGAGATGCTSAGGSQQCTCAKGFGGDGTKRCSDLDECASGVVAACGAGASQCVNSAGSFACACSAPYAQNIDRQGCHLRAWGASKLVESDNAGAALHPAVAVHSSGNVLVVWDQSDGTHTNIWANSYSFGGAWGARTLIETDNAGDANSPAIAMDGAGNALAVWMQSDGTRTNIWANRYSATGGTWGTATLIEANNTGDAGRPALAVDPAGNALAVWEQSDGAASSVWSNRLVTGGSWAAPTSLAPAGAQPAIAMDSFGNAQAVWQEVDAGAHIVVARRFRVAGSWSPDAFILSDTTGGFEPRVAMDSTGNAVAIWRSYNGMKTHANASRYAPATGWSTAALIDDVPGNASAVRTALDDSGSAVGIWRSEYGGIRGNRYTAGIWGAATDIDPDKEGTPYGTSVVMDGAGNALAVWARDTSGASSIWAARLTSGSWGARTLIGTSTTSDAGPAVATDPSGNATVVWVAADGAVLSIWAKTFE